jgi:hypothetical protein
LCQYLIIPSPFWKHSPDHIIWTGFPLV